MVTITVLICSKFYSRHFIQYQNFAVNIHRFNPKNFGKTKQFIIRKSIEIITRKIQYVTVCHYLTYRHYGSSFSIVTKVEINIYVK